MGIDPSENLVFVPAQASAVRQLKRTRNEVFVLLFR